MSDAETHRQLDDILRRLAQLEAHAHPIYQRGTFSPTYFGSTTAGATTYTKQSGDWRRWGTIAAVMGEVTWTAATGTGNARIGMPGNLAPSADGVGVVYVNAVTFAASAPSAIIQSAGGGQLRLFSYTTNAAPTEVAIEAAGDIRFCIVYFI